jgi:hypothetical protein
MEGLVIKHDLQQQEDRYIKTTWYLKTDNKKETDRLYHKQVMEMTTDMMKTGTIADSARVM